jgi:hypothetical protein
MKRNKEFLSKKGAVTDAIFLPIFITTIACTIFIAIYVWITFQTNFSLLVADTPHNATIVEAMNNISGGLQSFDYMFPFIVIGLLVISLIFAYKTGASVLYAFISIVLWGFAMLISALLTNIFGQFEVSFPDIAASFTTLTFIMNNMKFFVLVWLFLLGIVMFTRDKKEEKQISASEAVWGG